jgi:diguanylate cyclase (GGDEF)-like protein
LILRIFDVSSTLLFDIGVDFFAILVLIIIYINDSKSRSNSYSDILFRYTQFTLIMLIATDIVMWLINGVPGTISKIIGYADNTLFYVFLPSASIFWLKYSWYQVYKNPVPPKIELFLCKIPFTFLLLCDITAPWFKLLFYLDDKNFYHRGVLNSVESSFLLAYMLYITVIAFIKYTKAVLLTEKSQYLSIGFFIIPPFIGGILQTLTYGLSLTLPFTTYSILLLYLNKQSRAISKDSLTQLNNREAMDNYLQLCINSEKDSFAFVFFDINSFKLINDTYGHLNGDKALITFSSLLINSFKKNEVFLARYGGDEFVAIVHNCDELSIKEDIEHFQNNLSESNTQKNIPYVLTASTGYAFYPSSHISTTAELIQAADDNMYQNKKLFYKIISSEKNT